MNARAVSFRPRVVRTPRICVSLRVGRLFEIRVDQAAGEHAHEDMLPFTAQVERELARTYGKVVVCSDFRDASVLSPERAEAFNELLRLVSPRVERSAVLMSQEQATFNMQLQRMVLSNGTAVRRSFYDEREGMRWLGETLTPIERERLVTFVTGARPLTSLPAGSNR